MLKLFNTLIRYQKHLHVYYIFTLGYYTYKCSHAVPFIGKFIDVLLLFKANWAYLNDFLSRKLYSIVISCLFIVNQNSIVELFSYYETVKVTYFFLIASVWLILYKSTYHQFSISFEPFPQIESWNDSVESIFFSKKYVYVIFSFHALFIVVVRISISKKIGLRKITS